MVINLPSTRGIEAESIFLVVGNTLGDSEVEDQHEELEGFISSEVFLFGAPRAAFSWVFM